MEIFLISIGTVGLVSLFSLYFLTPRPEGQQEIVSRRLNKNQPVSDTPLLLTTGQEQTIWERVSDFLFDEDKLIAFAGHIQHVDMPQKDHPFVSRAGIKLQHALVHFNIDPAGDQTIPAQKTSLGRLKSKFGLR